MERVTTWPFSQVAGLAGLGFALAILLGGGGLALAGLPVTGSGPSEVIAFFTTGQDVVGVLSAFTPLAWALAVVFGAGAVSVLWGSDRARGEAWSLVGFAGLILQNATMAGVIAIRLALASTAAHDSSAIAGFWAMHDALFTLNGTFLALALTGLSISGMHAGVVRRWHGGLGLLSAALLFTSATLAPLVIDHAGPLGLVSLIGWLMWVVWIVTYGIILIRLVPNRHPAVAA